MKKSKPIFLNNENLTIIGRLAIFAVLFIIFGFAGEFDKSLTCVNNHSYCIAKSSDFYNIKHEEKVFIPRDISSINIEEYQHRKSLRGIQSTVTYRLNIIDKQGEKYKVFDGYTDFYDVQKKQQEITQCIKQEQYPCTIEEY